MNTPPSRSARSAICSLTAAAALSAPGARAQEPLPPPQFPDVCGIQLKTNSWTPEVMDEVHQAGFRAIRRGFYWEAIESEKGVYDFSKYDKEMQHAKELGLKVVGCFFGGNELYGETKGGVQTEEGRKGFAKFAAATAEHFKDYGVLWEVWNEPNVRTFWRKNGKHNSPEFAQEYTDLVKEVMPEVLKAEPNAFVMAGSVSNYWQPSYEWTESCFKLGILKTGIRGWSVHPYGVKTPEEFAIGHSITRDLLIKYGAPDLPMLDTERGFSIGKTVGGARPDEGWSGGSKERALEFQSWNLVRQFMLDQLHGVRLTIWYEWGGEQFGISKKNNPARLAFEEMVRQLSGYRLDRRLEADSDLDYVLVFKNEAGERKLVAWTAPPAKGTPDEAVDHPIALQIAKPASVDPFSVVGIDGRPGQSEGKDGAVVLSLSGAPQYVTVPPGVEFGTVKSLAKKQVAKPDAAPEGKDLALFSDESKWKFLKNTGAGSFMVKEEDGTQIGVLAYDFGNAEAKGTPYVLAAGEVDIPEGPTALSLRARSSVRQPLTFRIIDSTGQNLQYKSKLKGTGEWELITIPLDRKLEHWKGANDGIVHFPIESIILSVPLPGPDAKTGTVEYADATLN